MVKQAGGVNIMVQDNSRIKWRSCVLIGLAGMLHNIMWWVGGSVKKIKTSNRERHILPTLLSVSWPYKTYNQRGNVHHVGCPNIELGAGW